MSYEKIKAVLPIPSTMLYPESPSIPSLLEGVLPVPGK